MNKEPNSFVKSKRTEHRIRAENLAFDIDVWYPKVEQFTFRSTFLPLSLAEALAIQEFHNCTWRNARKDGLKVSELVILENLSNRITNEIKNKFNNKGVFMRLCGRSPKDGDPLNKNIAIDTYDDEIIKMGLPLNIYQEQRKKQKKQRAEMIKKTLNKNKNNIHYILDPENNNQNNENENENENDDDWVKTYTKEEEGNLKMVAIGRSTPSWLMIKNGTEALNLLLTSERVYADMMDWLQYGEPEQIVLREWEPELTTEYEFRAFIYQNKLTAISQYDHYTAYPTLEKEKVDIKLAIVSAWKELHTSVGECTYVADFAYFPSTKEAKLVELSPYLDVTGPALFHWEKDKDLLRGIKHKEEKDGEDGLVVVDDDDDDDDDNKDSRDIHKKEDVDDEVVFRILSKGHPQASELVEANWENRWRKNCKVEDDGNSEGAGEGDEGADEGGDESEEGFWNLLPDVQHISLNPRTFQKRNLIHNLSKNYIVPVIYNIELYIFHPIIHFIEILILNLRLKLQSIKQNIISKNKKKNNNSLILNIINFIELLSKETSFYDMLSNIFTIINYIYIGIKYLLFKSKFLSYFYLNEDSNFLLFLKELFFIIELIICIIKFEYRLKKGNDPLIHTLFVYGTLKEHFHWNQKYLGDQSGAKKIGIAETVNPLALYVGDSGVPYLILNEAKTEKTNNNNKKKNNNNNNGDDKNKIRGEIWLISTETLNGLDEYEGINKSYYIRKTEPVRLLLQQDDQDEGNDEGKDKNDKRNHKKNKKLLKKSSTQAQVYGEDIQAQVYGTYEFPPSLSSSSSKTISEYTLELHKECYQPIRHIQVKQQKHLGNDVGTSSHS